MKLQFYRKQVFGRELMYLVDCKEARAIRGLTEKSTIDNYQMVKLGELGFEFEEVLAPRA